MKKTITSAGLVVMSAAALHAQSTVYAPAPGLSSTELSKPWSIAASLRGFYDDNYATAPKSAKEDAFGFEISPSASLNWTQPQTYFGLSYRYGFRYYEGRPDTNYDQIHQVDLKLNHTFSERYKIEVMDSFVSAQEPELISASGGVVMPLRSDGDNIRNTAGATFTAGMTEHLEAVFGYTNNYYDYDQTGTGSYSALLDRMEHMGILNLRWQVKPATVALVGYQYGVMNYSSSDLLAPAPNTLEGQDRDSDSHYIYVGADHSFNSKLQGSARVGAQFTQYDQFSDEDSGMPYADASLTYTYNPGSYALLGVRNSRNATDVAYLSATDPTLDQATTTVYGSINHKLTAKLTGSLMAQAQFSEFEGGSVDGEGEIFFMSGVNLSYEINKFLAADAGYNFDRLDSDISNRSYSRNRVYIGLRATY